MNFVPYAIPFFILAILVEFVYAKVTGRFQYRLNDTLASLSMGTLSRLMGVVRLGLFGVLFDWILNGHTVLAVSMESPLAWIAAFVLYDLCYYFLHRFGHEWRILWAAHSAHHQSEEYNLSTALRQTSTGFLGGIFYAPLYMLGFPTPMLIAVGSLNLIYQFWVHTEHVRRLGVIDRILVTPSNHRVHHAKNPCYIDRNYGGVFVLWDRLFGTFEDERESEPCVYGVTEQLNSFNPLWANLHVYVQGIRDTFAATRWSDKITLWFKGPGFKPAGTDQSPHDWLAPKFDPQITAFTKRYTFIHFWLLVISTFVLIGWENELSRPWVYSLAVLIAFGYYTQGAMLEGRGYAPFMELARLVGIVFAAVLLLWSTQPQWCLAICSVAGASALTVLFQSMHFSDSSSRSGSEQT